MMRIRTMTEADADAVLAIYGEGIATGHATFETTTPGWAAFSAGRLASPRLVAEDEDGRVVGWAVLSATSSRCVYAGVAESTLYVGAAARGKGVGKVLLTALIEASEAAGFWTLHAGVFPENTASLALHAACGFRRVGVREREGRMSHGPMAGRWRDVVFLERRSTVVGVD